MAWKVQKWTSQLECHQGYGWNFIGMKGVLQCHSLRGMMLCSGPMRGNLLWSVVRRCSAVSSARVLQWSRGRDGVLWCGPLKWVLFCSVVPWEECCSAVWCNERNVVLQCGPMIGMVLCSVVPWEGYCFAESCGPVVLWEIWCSAVLSHESNGVLQYVPWDAIYFCMGFTQFSPIFLYWIDF